MKAFIINKPYESEVGEYSLRDLKEDEVLVKVKACGICGTDIHIFKGEFPAKFPVIPGHEFSGVVEEVGENVTRFKKGDRVAVNPNIPCGKCYYCKRGLTHFCVNWNAIGIHLPGAYAEYAIVPEANLYSFPEYLEFEEAAFAEPVACVLHGQDLINISLGDTVVVYGLGPIGLLHLQLSMIRGASKVIGVDIVEKKLKIAEELGAEYVFNALEKDVPEEIKKVLGRGADVAIEASGSIKAFEDAIKSVDYGGKVLVFGVAPENATAAVKPFNIYRREIEIIGSFTNPFTTGRAVKILASRKINVKKIISHRISLDEVQEYYKKIMDRDKTILKVIVKP
ncbi:MAG: zinc-dependent alcohol dehydrogenase family protein [Thermoproteales archaeon]|nr:zinc-dependent alcohol dehydrogenase family protein [Thermoproteales archaeon]